MPESVDVKVRALGCEKVVEDGHRDGSGDETESSLQSDGELKRRKGARVELQCLHTVAIMQKREIENVLGARRSEFP